MKSKTLLTPCGEVEYSENLGKNLNEQRKTGRHCDFILKTEDGSKIPAHKCVLEAVSTFFEKLFKAESNESNPDSHLMKKVSSDVLDKIVKYMYTGKTDVSPKNAKEMLNQAVNLDLKELVDECTQALVDSVNKDNCFEMFEFSKTYFAGEDLADKCIEVMLQNLDTVIESPKFVNLPSEVVKIIVSRPDRAGCKEEQLYLAINKWITFDLERRKPYTRPLMDKIKFEDISIEFGLSKILKDNPLLETNDFILKMNDVLKQSLIKQMDLGRANEKILAGDVENVFAIVGNEMLLYDCHCKPFTTPITKIREDCTKFGYSTFDDSNFFICGGLLNGSAVSNSGYFSAETKKWSDLPSMQEPRFGHRAVTLDDKIYVVGGVDTSTVEVFDIPTKKWSKGPPINCDFMNFGLCKYDNCIYAIDKDDFRRLDPRENKWSWLPPNNEVPIRTAVAHGDSIYGFNSQLIKTFDVRNSKWLDNTKMYEISYDISEPEVCIIDDQIFVFDYHSEIDENNSKYLLQSYNANDLSLSYHFGFTLPKKGMCWALFPMKL